MSIVPGPLIAVMNVHYAAYYIRNTSAKRSGIIRAAYAYGSTVSRCAVFPLQMTYVGVA